MANTLTNLIPDAYVALDVVSKELVGFIPSVARDAKADETAIGQTLRVVVTPANAAGGDFTPSMTLPSAADQTIGNKSLTITKQRFYPFSWTGEEQYAVDEMYDGEQSVNFLTIEQDQIAQAMRAALNEMESDIALAAKLGASRAYGTAGATPFASNLGDPAQMKKILDDNGAPPSDRHLTINTTAGAAVRTLSQLTKANEAADSSLLRQGTLLDLHGFSLRESAQVKNHVKGAGTSYVVNGAHAIGATNLVIKTGSGTVVAGDVLTLQGDTNKYVVTTGVGAPGTVVLAAPGLLAAHADGDTVTIGNNYAANMAYTRNAILLATRLPVVPKKGDQATDRTVITDPRTGISFMLSYYPGVGMGVYWLQVNWGVSVIKPEHLAILLG